MGGERKGICGKGPGGGGKRLGENLALVIKGREARVEGPDPLSKTCCIRP
jgi:hypothetical protein